MNTEWKCYIKNYNFQICQKTIINKYDYKVNFSWKFRRKETVTDIDLNDRFPYSLLHLN